MVESIPTSPPPETLPSRDGPSFFDSFTLWDADGFGFDDLLDVINPLQHIPVVSTLYREWTGDEIGHAARVAGGGLFGGVIGVAAAAANVLLKETSGNDLGEHVVALFQGDDDAVDTTGTMVANADLPEGAVEVEGLPWLAAARDAGPVMASNVAAPGSDDSRPLAAVPDKRPLAPGALDARFVAAAAPALAAQAAPALAAQAAARDGSGPGPLPGQLSSGPWIADAMQSALDKYQALMLTRGQRDGSADLSL